MTAALKKRRMTYDELVTECKRLRRESEQSEARLFLFLMMAETDYVDVWSGFGCASFDQFLRSNGPLAKPERYALFKIGVSKTSAEQAAKFGVHWTIQAGKLDSDADVKQLADRAEAFVKIHLVGPAEETASKWRAEAQGRGQTNTAKAVAKASEIVHLRTENAKLKADVQTMPTNMADARKRILDLEVELKAAKARIRDLERALAESRN